MNRTGDLIRLYRIFDTLEASTAGKRLLAQLAPCGSWPRRGVYFFFEPGEVCSGSGHGSRLVRIGTQALGVGARSTLHYRLRQQPGNSSGPGGNEGRSEKPVAPVSVLSGNQHIVGAAVSEGVEVDDIIVMIRIADNGRRLRRDCRDPVHRLAGHRTTAIGLPNGKPQAWLRAGGRRGGRKAACGLPLALDRGRWSGPVWRPPHAICSPPGLWRPPSPYGSSVPHILGGMTVPAGKSCRQPLNDPPATTP